MEQYQYVIVGGGLAGGSALEAIRTLDRDCSIALITDEAHRPYQRPPLSKEFLRGDVALDAVYLENKDHYLHENVDLIEGVRVDGLSVGTRFVTLDDGRMLKYGRLLLATGGRARRLSLPGDDLPGIYTLRNIEDSEAIRAAAGQGKQVLVLGGSFIGSEVASSLSQLGSHVTMVFPNRWLLERVAPEELGRLLHGIYTERGVHLRPGTSVERFEGDGVLERAVLDDGDSLPVDLVVMGVGIDLNTDVAHRAGLEMTEDGGVVVDEYLCTSEPHIYAAGDIAAWPDPTFGRRLRVEHWDVAKNQGQRAGRNMAGENQPYTTLPYFFSDLFDLSFEVWGNLDAWEQTVLRGSLDVGSFAFYYFDDDRLVGVLAVDRPEEERDVMRALVERRLAFESVAGGLRDTGASLQSLLD